MLWRRILSFLRNGPSEFTGIKVVARDIALRMSWMAEKLMWERYLIGHYHKVPNDGAKDFRPVPKL